MSNYIDINDLPEEKRDLLISEVKIEKEVLYNTQTEKELKENDEKLLKDKEENDKEILND